MTQNDDKKSREKNQNKKKTSSDSGKQRKEKVLHTRVPTVLEQELKALAKNLRVPVSNLVRTILQDAMTTAEALGRVAEGELRGAAEKLAENRARLDAAAAAQGDILRESLEARDLLVPPWPSDEPKTETEPDAASEPASEPEPESETDPELDPDPEPESPKSQDPLEGVLGFQEMLLAVPSECAICGTTLDRGKPAYLGVRGAPGPQVIIGPECLPGNKESE